MGAAEQRDRLLARTAARGSHPTFPAAHEAERQAAAVDATMRAMEWPTEEEAEEAEEEDEEDEEGGGGAAPPPRRLLVRCDPWARAEERDEAIVERVFRAIVWPVAAAAEDGAADWSHALAVEEAVRLTIRAVAGEAAAVRLSIEEM